MNPKKSTYDAPVGFADSWERTVRNCPERMENGICFMAKGNLKCTEGKPADTCDCPCFESDPTEILCPDCFMEGHYVKLYRHTPTGALVCLDESCAYIGTEEGTKERTEADKADFEADWGYEEATR